MCIVHMWRLQLILYDVLVGEWLGFPFAYYDMQSKIIELGWWAWLIQVCWTPNAWLPAWLCRSFVLQSWDEVSGIWSDPTNFGLFRRFFLIVLKNFNVEIPWCFSNLWSRKRYNISSYLSPYMNMYLQRIFLCVFFSVWSS